jgi:hypothetical protein
LFLSAYVSSIFQLFIPNSNNRFPVWSAVCSSTRLMASRTPQSLHAFKNDGNFPPHLTYYCS